MASAPTRVWRVQSYSDQENTLWPKEGRHVLAQYDDDTVVVYQAYCPEIADYAVKHQKCVRITCTVRLVPHKHNTDTRRCVEQSSLVPRPPPIQEGSGNQTRNRARLGRLI